MDYGTLFTKICKEGTLCEAKEYHALNKDRMKPDYVRIFRHACSVGYLDLAKWIYPLSNISAYDLNGNISAFSYYALKCFRFIDYFDIYYMVIADYYHPTALEKAYIYNHIDVVKWIQTLGKIDASTYDEFLTSLGENRVEMLQFLLESGANLHVPDNALLKRFSSWENKLEVCAVLLPYCDTCHYEYLDETSLGILSVKMKSARKS